MFSPIRWSKTTFEKEETCKSLWLNDGAPGMIRTCDPLIRSQVLYPTELRVRGGKYKWLGGNSKTGKNGLRALVLGLWFSHKTSGDSIANIKDQDQRPKTKSQLFSG
jgi:hypothetical protein